MAIKICDKELLSFRFDEGFLLLSLLILDDQDKPVVQIIDNEMVLQTEFWDVEFAGKHLTVRQGRGDIFLNLVFDVENSALMVEKATLRHQGKLLRVFPDRIEAPNGNIVSQNFLRNCGTGFNCK